MVDPVGWEHAVPGEGISAVWKRKEWKYVLNEAYSYPLPQQDTLSARVMHPSVEPCLNFTSSHHFWCELLSSLHKRNSVVNVLYSHVLSLCWYYCKDTHQRGYFQWEFSKWKILPGESFNYWVSSQQWSLCFRREITIRSEVAFKSSHERGSHNEDLRLMLNIACSCNTQCEVMSVK